MLRLCRICAISPARRIGECLRLLVLALFLLVSTGCAASILLQADSEAAVELAEFDSAELVLPAGKPRLAKRELLSLGRLLFDSTLRGNFSRIAGEVSCSGHLLANGLCAPLRC